MVKKRSVCLLMFLWITVSITGCGKKQQEELVSTAPISSDRRMEVETEEETKLQESTETESEDETRESAPESREDIEKNEVLLSETDDSMVSTSEEEECSYGDTIPEQKSTDYIDMVDFTDSSIWRTGDYEYQYGEYIPNPGRMCTPQYFPVKNTDYLIYVNNVDCYGNETKYKFVIREYDENLRYLEKRDSVNTTDGSVYRPSLRTKYIRIVLYRDSDDGFSYRKWLQAFEDGYSFGFTDSENPKEDVETKAAEDAENTKNPESVMAPRSVRKEINIGAFLAPPCSCNKEAKTVHEAKDGVIRDITAREFTDSIHVGWNLGNSMDVKGTEIDGKPNLWTETYWGNTEVSQDLIDHVLECGFDLIRIPVTWSYHTYTDENGKVHVHEEWLQRVKEVVDYAYGNHMKIIINMHHEQKIIYAGVSDKEFAQVLKISSEIWEDIAYYFKDYDETLVFESFNEVDNLANSWQYGEQAAKQMNELNQLFVDTVRATGGNNTKRILCVPTLTDGTSSRHFSGFVLPKDVAEDKLIVQVHDYSKDFTPGIAGKFEEMEEFSKVINAPVIIGEWGTTGSYFPKEFREVHASNFVARAKAHGITTIYWDNGSVGDYAIINRRDFSQDEKGMIQAITQAVPFTLNEETKVTQWKDFYYATFQQATGKVVPDPFWGSILYPVGDTGYEIPDGTDYIAWSFQTKKSAAGYEVHYAFFYDKNMRCIEKYCSNHSVPIAFEVPEGAKYFRFGINSDRLATKETEYEHMINKGEMQVSIYAIDLDKENFLQRE